MRCHEVRQLFFLYHDSELDPRSVQEVNLHLEACPDCRGLWAREGRLEEAIARAAWEGAGPLEDFPWEEVEARIRAARARRRVPGGWAGAALALLLAAVAALVFLQVNRSAPGAEAAAHSAMEHHEKYLAGKSPVQVRGPESRSVRDFYAGELGFEVVVPEGERIAVAAGVEAELVGARRCTFLGGPVAYVTYRIGGQDVTAILGPLRPPEGVMEEISRSPAGMVEREAGECCVLLATVRGVLFVATGRTVPDGKGPDRKGPETLRRLLEAFQEDRP
jgi:Zn-finger nucleic acid-binding protein